MNMKMKLIMRAIGAPLDRLDGIEKVTRAAGTQVQVIYASLSCLARFVA